MGSQVHPTALELFSERVLPTFSGVPATDMQLTYEEFSSCPGHLKHVFDMCGVDAEIPTGIATLVRPQSSDADLRRIREIRSYLGGCDPAPGQA